jgi:adenine-specific DNA-methyltransferase
MVSLLECPRCYDGRQVDDNLTSQGNPFYSVTYKGKSFSGTYKTTLQGIEKLALASRLYAAEGSLRYIRFVDDFPAVPLNAAWMDIGGIQSRSDPKIYVVQTSVEAIKRCMLMTTDPGDLVLDPTCGSGTTAYVAEQWGRRWITIDTSRISIALARTRLMAGRYPYYLLLDSPEGQKKERELTGQWSAEDDAIPTSDQGDIKRGFVYKRVPHITLKAIANNEEIDAIHEKFQPRLEELRAKINAAAGKNWQEWEIPRTVTSDQSAVISEALAEYWNLRCERQREIDASIARRADVEMLYDQPYEDPKRIRVAGPFTVESLSPHRVLTTDDPATPLTEDKLNEQGFTQMILENLKAAGVQNTFKNERLKFTRLDPYAGTWLNAVGEYNEQDGTARRVAISIGPELGTVSADQVKEAAKEAVMGVGFDLLIICGFAFDPHVSEEAKRYGRLTVLPTRMNPDLAMGDELLKRTGAGNLFMVFGEPDVDIRQTDDGKMTVTINGVDVYDPTTGEIRSNTTDDIACWFIDSDYSGESFIVRHAYFTGADEPYEKLKRALRSEIDESAWSALYSVTSYPFEKPKSGKIAVKVINHYGDEVLKVFDVT